MDKNKKQETKVIPKKRKKAITPKTVDKAETKATQKQVDKSATNTLVKHNCPTCKHEFETTKIENVRCPLCKATWIVRLKPNMNNYVTGLGVTISGRDTVDINDYVAGLLRGLSVPQTIEKTAKILDDAGKLALSAKNTKHKNGFAGTTEAWLLTKYEDKNPGMIRMNLGNLLRGCINRTQEAIT